jgi:hypothetical protein
MPLSDMTQRGGFEVSAAGTVGGCQAEADAASVEQAAELFEIYWQVRLRDVAFEDYDTDRLAGGGPVAPG